MKKDYQTINREAWNQKVAIHLDSAFYNMSGFLEGESSLKEIELSLLGDLKGKRVLHLQCHFGQDSLSMARLGAQVTGVDLSDKAIDKAKELAADLGIKATFLCCDLYDLPEQLDEQFDIVFTSYGTIGWLPDMEGWAAIVARYLKPGGRFVFVEFHPVVWMFDDEFENIAYSYFNTGPIVETYTGSYADRDAKIEQQYMMWNHSMAAVINSLIQQGLQLRSLEEFDYSPYDCFKHTVEVVPGRFRIAHLGDKLPMVYALTAQRIV